MAAAAVVVTVVALQTGPGAQPAFAVTGERGSDLTIEINQTEGADGLRAALADKGVQADVTYLPWGRACAEGRFAEADTSGRTGILGFGGNERSYTIVLGAGVVATGETLVLVLSRDPDAQTFRGQVGIADGPVAPCREVDAPPPPDPPPGSVDGGGVGGTG